MSLFCGLSNKRADNSMDVRIIDEMQLPVLLLILLFGNMGF